MKNVIVILVLLLLFACVQTEEEKIVAQVNDAKLTEEEFKANFTDKEWNDLTVENKKALIQDWIQLTLLAQEAEVLKISESLRIKEKIKSAKLNILANALIAQKLANISVTEDELFNYYKVHKNEYRTSHKEYKVQRIFTKQQDKLNIILDEIKNSSFKEAAKKYSEEPAGNNGGYIGFLSKNNTHINIWNTLKSLNKYYYKTVQTERGYYIVRYYDTRTVYDETPFLEVKEDIKKAVIKNKKEEMYDSLIKDLKDRSEIIISI